MVVLHPSRILQQRHLLYALVLASLLLVFMRQAWTIRYRRASEPIQEPFDTVRSFSDFHPPPVGSSFDNSPPEVEESPEFIQPRPRIAKVTVALGDASLSGADRCLRTHQVQNELYGYQHFIGQTKLVADRHVAGPVMSARWTKHAYLLHLILTELQKPEAERLEWLFWFDADTMILNPNIRLETFIPPASDPKTSRLKFLIARNWDDINDGAFLIKVDIWSITLLSGILAYPIDHLHQKPFPHEQDVLSDFLHKSPIFQSDWTVVPHRWFNSFPVNNVYQNVNGTIKYLIAEPLRPQLLDNGDRVINETDGSDLTLPWKVLKGNMALHFAGVQHRKTWISQWADRAEMLLPEWSNPIYQKILQEDVDTFWEEWQPHVPIQIKGHLPSDALGNNMWF